MIENRYRGFCRAMESIARKLAGGIDRAKMG